MTTTLDQLCTTAQIFCKKRQATDASSRLMAMHEAADALLVENSSSIHEIYHTP